MKMSDRSLVKYMGLLVLGSILLVSSGRTAQAADGEHGNPGQFIENIRKGLSGISKYFWSPKSNAQDEQSKVDPLVKKDAGIAPGKVGSPAASGKPVQQGKKAQAPKVLPKPVAKIKTAPATKTTKAAKEQLDINTELRAIAKHPKKATPTIADRQGKPKEGKSKEGEIKSTRKTVEKPMINGQTSGKKAALADKPIEPQKSATVKIPGEKNKKQGLLQAPKAKAIVKAPTTFKNPLVIPGKDQEKTVVKKHANIIRPGAVSLRQTNLDKDLMRGNLSPKKSSVKNT